MLPETHKQARKASLPGRAGLSQDECLFVFLHVFGMRFSISFPLALVAIAPMTIHLVPATAA
ncbi:MAG: hypothetical protein RR311_21960 [Comamonas sp.]